MGDFDISLQVYINCYNVPLWWKMSIGMRLYMCGIWEYMGNLCTFTSILLLTLGYFLNSLNKKKYHSLLIPELACKPRSVSLQRPFFFTTTWDFPFKVFFFFQNVEVKDNFFLFPINFLLFHLFLLFLRFNFPIYLYLPPVFED